MLYLPGAYLSVVTFKAFNYAMANVGLIGLLPYLCEFHIDVFASTCGWPIFLYIWPRSSLVIINLHWDIVLCDCLYMFYYSCTGDGVASPSNCTWIGSLYKGRMCAVCSPCRKKYSTHPLHAVQVSSPPNPCALNATHVPYMPCTSSTPHVHPLFPPSILHACLPGSMPSLHVPSMPHGHPPSCKHHIYTSDHLQCKHWWVLVAWLVLTTTAYFPPASQGRYAHIMCTHLVNVWIIICIQYQKK